MKQHYYSTVSKLVYKYKKYGHFEPITHQLYNIIIEEAFNIRPEPFVSYYMENGQPCLHLDMGNNYDVKYYDDSVVILYKHEPIMTIPYTQYTTIIELFNKLKQQCNTCHVSLRSNHIPH